MVDIIGCDKYNCADGVANLSSISSTFYSLVQSTDGQKMVTMSENDSIPSLENLVNDKAAWLYFCPWYMNYLTSEQNNPVDNLVEIYNSDYCITLDELPDLKSYPINGGGDTVVTVTTVTSEPVTTTSTSAVSTTSEKTAASTTTTVSQTSDTTSADYRKGDANCDGNVDMADAVLIMQSLANPDKYGVNGTDSHHITSQGLSNGDVDTGSKGLTSNDALEIQRYLLGLVKWDDIKAN